MSSNIIYKDGGLGVNITIPAAGSIAIKTRGVAKLYEVVSYPTQPTSLNLLGTVTNGQTVFGPYTNGKTVQVHAGADNVLYQVGSSPVVLEDRNLRVQPTPTAKTAAATLTIAELLTGLITITHATGATVALTLPTGALIDAGLDMDVNESFDWTVINPSAAAADTATVTAGTGHTVVGTMIVQSAHATTGLLYGNAATFRTRKTAAETFVTYRVG